MLHIKSWHIVFHETIFLWTFRAVAEAELSTRLFFDRSPDINRSMAFRWSGYSGMLPLFLARTKPLGSEVLCCDRGFGARPESDPTPKVSMLAALCVRNVKICLGLLPQEKWSGLPYRELQVSKATELSHSMHKIHALLGRKCTLRLKAEGGSSIILQFCVKLRDNSLNG